MRVNFNTAGRVQRMLNTLGSGSVQHSAQEQPLQRALQATGTGISKLVAPALGLELKVAGTTTHWATDHCWLTLLGPLPP